MKVRFNADVQDPLFSMAMVSSQKMQLFSASSVFDDPRPGLFRAGEEVTYRVGFQNILGPDRYTVTTAVTAGDTPLELRERMLSVVVTRVTTTGTVVDIPYDQQVERPVGAPVAGEAPS